MSELQWLMFDFEKDVEVLEPWPDTPTQRRQASAAEVRTAASQAENRNASSASED